MYQLWLLMDRGLLLDIDATLALLFFSARSQRAVRSFVAVFAEGSAIAIVAARIGFRSSFAPVLAPVLL